MPSATDQQIHFVAVRFADVKYGFLMVPRRWVVERTFALSTRFQRLLNAGERLPEVVEGRQVLSFVGL